MELTIERITAAQIPSGKTELKLWDSAVNGLYLRIFASGRRSWVYRYRSDGGGRSAKIRSIKLGSYPALTLDAARAAVQPLAGEIAKQRISCKTRQVTEAKPGCQLYRHYDKDGMLLYVGVSLSTVYRLGQHRENAHWFNKIVKVTIKNFRTRAAALAAERDAIRDEEPLCNIALSKLNDTPPLPTFSLTALPDDTDLLPDEVAAVGRWSLAYVEHRRLNGSDGLEWRVINERPRCKAGKPEAADGRELALQTGRRTIMTNNIIHNLCNAGSPMTGKNPVPEVPGSSK